MNKKYKTLFSALVIAALIASAVFVSSNYTIPAAKASTTVPSSMLQYEWKSPAESPSRTSFSDGPAPNQPNILWKAKVPLAVGPLVGFNGLVFAQSVTKLVGNVAYIDIYALDGATGNVVWKQTGFVGGITGVSLSKIDDTYMVVANKGVRIADGAIVWTGPTGFSQVQTMFSGAGYVAELEMFVSETYGWNLPDPSQPPTLAWNITNEQNIGAGFAMYGDGKVFIGSQDGFLRARNALDGTLIWTAPITSDPIYGMSYYEGKVIHGGLDNNMRAWDANTGKLLWTYNPGTYYGQWASATAVAYGMVYEHNQDTYVYAINATTGQLVWRAKGPGIGYSNVLSVADGKVFVEMGENQYRDFATGEYAKSEFDAFDAFTGELVWTLPVENGAPFNSQCIAFGNLYIIPTAATPIEGIWTYPAGGTGSLSEVWAIGSEVTDWPMFLKDPAHTAEGNGPTNLSLKWTFKTNGQIWSSPTLVKGVAYFGSLDSNISQLMPAQVVKYGISLRAFQLLPHPQ